MIRTHGQAKKTSEYLAWTHMKTRCYNKKYQLYHRYGGRGIKVCDRWLHSFENFFTDMGKKPSKAHSLDRFPNVDGCYEPLNCRWATPKQQSGNRGNNRWIEYDGKKMILQDWAIHLKTDPHRIIDLLKSGNSFNDAYSRISNKKDFLIFDTQTGIFYEKLKEAAFAKNIHPSTLGNKLCGFRRNNTGLISV